MLGRFKYLDIRLPADVSQANSQQVTRKWIYTVGGSANSSSKYFSNDNVRVLYPVKSNAPGIFLSLNSKKGENNDLP